MGIEDKEVVFSRKVLDMITVGNEFCIFIEECQKYEKDYILTYFEKILPLLYLKGSLLPQLETHDSSANERFVTEEQWAEIHLTLKKKLDKSNLFSFVDNEIDTGSLSDVGLADIMTDIYQDLKDFILLYQRNTMNARVVSVYYCKFLFEHHWGKRIIMAMYAIHNILYGENLQKTESDYWKN